MKNGRPVLVLGGGIAGLALALALARGGRGAIVLESRPRFATEGAGIQLGANGVKVLERLGLAERLRPEVGEPASLVVFDGRSARRLAQLPLGGWFAARHGAPYWTMHRGDLHAALVATARQQRHVELRADYALKALRQEPSGVLLEDRAGQRLVGAALVGADGLWSTVRQTICPAARPQLAGATAARALLAAGVAGALAEPHVGLWLGAGANVVHYPVRAGREVAVVIIVREPWSASAAESRVAAKAALAPLGAFHHSLTDVLGRAADYRKWALYRLARLPTWSCGRIGLIGDAAHPMLPHLAQGGALALEDGLLLGSMLGQANLDVAAALREFTLQRRGRAARVEALSRRNGQLYHLAPPLAWARDALLRVLPGRWLMVGYDWLYGWRPD
ncbi:MAG TPA: FAD-dependent monooxygenase [Hyphomicrobiaceae bacterium]|nr:FAD-dependent monooxygenase [Hyphomicrobiaceae bacterium]